MILTEEGQECKTLSIFSDFLMSSLRMYISENDVHIFIEWFYHDQYIQKIIEEMILFSSCLDCDSLILVLFWTRTLRFSTGNSRARKLSTRAQPISRTVIECLDHGNNFVCYEPSAVNSFVGGSKLHFCSSCTFLKVFRISLITSTPRESE